MAFGAGYLTDMKVDQVSKIMNTKEDQAKKQLILKYKPTRRWTCSQELFLKNDANKTQLIDLLTTQLIRDDIEVRRSSGDADTLIVSAALEYANK